MDIIGVIVFILVMAFSLLEKLGQEAGKDRAPQRPRRVPPRFPDFEKEEPAAQPEAAKTSRPVAQRPPAVRPESAADDARSTVMAGAGLQPVPALQPAPVVHSALISEPAAEDIIKGFIWAEILSPPRAKRPLEADCLRSHQ